MWRARLIYGFVFLALFSCGYRVEKEPAANLTASGTALDKMGYAEVQAQVLQTKCATCHAWATAEKYDVVLSRITDIQSRVISGSMPAANSSTGPLTATEKEILLSWIARGAPRDSISTPPISQPGNPPPPSSCIIDPTDPNSPCIGFAEVKAQVLQPKCATCHGFPSSYSSTLSKIQMIQTHVRDGIMPPQSATQLSNFEKSMLLSWINRGAPEFGTNNPSPPSPPPNNPPCDCTMLGGDDCRNTLTSDRRGDDCLN